MMFDILWKKLLFLFRRNRFDRELDEEMQFHLAMKTRENLDAGMPPEEAHYSAMRRFGNQPLLRETSREVWFSSSVESLLQDLRYGLRMLRRSPGFTAAAVLSLALGIGANTAIFSLIDALLLEKLPVKNPQQLVTISSVSAGGRDRMFSYTAYKDFRDQTESFAGALASSSVQKVNIVIGGPGEPQAELVERRLVSGNYFSVLGVDAIVGRTFTADEARVPGEQPLAVISYGYWQRRFGGDPHVVGKTFTAQDTLFTIIGVAPPEFFGESVGESPDLWMPLTMAPRAPSWLWKGHSVTWLQIMGRLKPGVTVEQAQASAALVFGRHPGPNGCRHGEPSVAAAGSRTENRACAGERGVFRTARKVFAAAEDSDGRGRRGAADCLRQRLLHDAGALDGPPERDGRPARPGCESHAPGPAIHY